MTGKTPLPSPFRRAVRTLGPWLVGLAIIIIIAMQVPLSAFRDAMTRGPHLSLAAVSLFTVVMVLCSDTWSTWFGLRLLAIRRPIVDVLLVRGAIYLLLLVNYAIGQGGFGVYLNRTGTKPLRAASAMLFLVGTNLATLLVLTAVAWLVRGQGSSNTIMAWSLWGGNVGLLFYLVLLRVKPKFLARRQLLFTLFETGVSGHLHAMLGRLPHTVVIVLGQWIALRTWGIPVPFSAAATLMPAVVLIAALPISPAGLGTTQAAMVFFFAPYAAGATQAEQGARVLAFGIVHFVYQLVAILLVGLVCLAFVKRRGLNGASPPK